MSVSRPARYPTSATTRTFPRPASAVAQSTLNAKVPKIELNAFVGTQYMNDIYCLESPVYQHESDSIPYTIRFNGGTAASAPGATVYKNGVDVTSTVMPAGSHTASGNTVTLKNLTALKGGETYVVNVSATVDSLTIYRKFVVKAVDPKAE